MTDPVSLVRVAEETLRVLERREYVAPSGRLVGLRDTLLRAIGGTVLHRPDEFSALFAERDRLLASRRNAPALRIEVTPETTFAAARRLVVTEGVERVAALNFASARHPGGGFLNGARAQEECLCRASALYPCLLAAPDYYAANQAHPSSLYTDHLIYTPDVPVFRDDRHAFFEVPFPVSVLTSPAPMAEAIAKNEPDKVGEILPTLKRRALQFLSAAVVHRHATLVLGAWGCGAFRNDPGPVAGAFADLLASAELRGAFGRVVFAVYDSGVEMTNFRAFQERLGT